MKNLEYAKQIKHNENRLAKLRERIEGVRNEIAGIEKEIRKYEGQISWNRNRSEQSRTICARGF